MVFYEVRLGKPIRFEIAWSYQIVILGHGKEIRMAEVPSGCIGSVDPDDSSLEKGTGFSLKGMYRIGDREREII